MGDLGDDKDVVDQKEGDGEDGENNKEEEKFEKDSKMTGKALEDETRTKEDDEREGREKDGEKGGEDDAEDDAKGEPQNEEQPDFGGEDEGAVNEDNPENYEEHTGVDVREVNKWMRMQLVIFFCSYCMSFGCIGGARRRKRAWLPPRRHGV